MLLLRLAEVGNHANGHYISGIAYVFPYIQFFFPYSLHFMRFFFILVRKGEKNGGECLNFPILAAPTTTRGWSRSSFEQLFNSLKLSCIRYYPMVYATTPI